MAKVSPLMIAPPLLFAALAGLFYWGMGREDADVLPSQLIGKAVPPVTLERLGETPLLTDAVLAEPGVKMVNFWGTWCVACRAEHPTLLWMHENLDVPLHGINFDDTTARALEYLARFGIHASEREAPLPQSGTIACPVLTRERYENERPSAEQACRSGDERLLRDANWHPPSDFERDMETLLAGDRAERG